MNPNSPEDKNFRLIRQLIWVYFWLLIFEGALRKWVLPSLSNPLLIVRDPVALAAYYLALRAGVFPKNRWVYAIAIIGFVDIAISFIPLWDYLPPLKIALVAGFGFRADFLHLPLIFVMARVLRPEDVKRFGFWILLLMVPMTLLMIAQFRAAPDAFLNRTAGGEGEMMTAALGKVRTAGTFSFVVGVVAFFALATGFGLWAALKRDVYKTWVLGAGAMALAIGTAVSGSRSVVAACAIVIASLAAVIVLRPQAVNRLGQLLLVVVVLGFIVTRTPIFQQGFHVLSTRFNEVAEATDKSIGAGALDRVMGDFGEGFFALRHAPIFGYGLGIGTNAGAKFLTGAQVFLLAEDEWARIILESGPLFGLAFVVWRVSLVVYIGRLCLRSVKRGNTLPLFLFASSFVLLFNGQFGQPTILGFCVFVTGLALAARKFDDDENIDLNFPSTARTAPTKRPMRRSAYASRLHGPGARPGQTNGSVDR